MGIDNSSWATALVRASAGFGKLSNATTSLFVDHWHTHDPVAEQQGPIYILIKNAVTCMSPDEPLGNFQSAQECAEACAAVAECKYFRYGYGHMHQGVCKHELTSSSHCPEGFSSGQYDFFALEPFGNIGLFMELWSGMHWWRLGDFDSLGPAEATAWLSGIHYRAGFQPVLNGKVYRDLFAARFTGQFESPTTGIAFFATCSDDGSKFFIRLRETWYWVVNNDGLHGTKCQAGLFIVEAGKSYGFEAQFWENWGGSTMELSWMPPGRPWQILSAVQLRPSPPPSPPPPPSSPPPSPPPLPIWWPKNDVEKMMVEVTVVQDVSTRLLVKMEKLLEVLAPEIDRHKYTGSAALLEIEASLPEHLRGVEIQTDAVKKVLASVDLAAEPALHEATLHEWAHANVSALLMSAKSNDQEAAGNVDVGTTNSLLEIKSTTTTAAPSGAETFASKQPEEGGGAASVIAGDGCGPESGKCKGSLIELWPEERISNVPGPRTLDKCDAGEICGMCLMAVPKDKCDTVDLPPSRGSNRFDIRNCDSHVETDGFCEADGECGTYGSLDNCGGWDLYQHVEYAPRDDQVALMTHKLQGVLADARSSLRLARKARDFADKLAVGSSADELPVSDYDVAFNGDTRSAVEIGPLPPLTSFSVSMWVKNLNPSRAGALFSLGNDETPAWVTVINPNGLIVGFNGRRAKSFPGTVALTEGEWKHLAFTWRATTGYWAVYVDGAQAALGLASTGGSTPSGSRLVLGQRPGRGAANDWMPGFSFEGQMSNVNFFRVELTPAQVPLTLRFVPNTLEGLFKAWHQFRHGLVGSGVSEIVPSMAFLAAPDCSGASCPSNNFDARFEEEEQGSLVEMGFKTLPEFTVCTWLRCDLSTHQNGRVAISYATIGADDTLVINSNFNFVLHGKTHLLRNAPDCSVWRHFCLAYDRGGHYSATIDGTEYVHERDAELNGLPQGGALIVGQHQRRLGAAFSPYRNYVGTVSAVGLWGTALNAEAIKQARESQTRGALKQWHLFRAGRKGTVTFLEPAQPKAPPSGSAAESDPSKHSVLRWKFDAGAKRLGRRVANGPKGVRADPGFWRDAMRPPEAQKVPGQGAAPLVP